MGDFVKNNQDFPPSIEKNLSFIYQKPLEPHSPMYPFKLKIISCFKHTNGTKLSSHLWFFEGFCRQFNPEFCVLLDVGTKPSPNGILKYLEAFTTRTLRSDWLHERGCLTSSLRKARRREAHNCCYSNFVSIEKAQEFEYIISHFIDKSFESTLGFLHVLPGAWSGYRYEALIHGEKFEQNLL